MINKKAYAVRTKGGWNVKNALKRLFVVLLSAVIMVTFFAPAAEAAPIKLNKSKITVSVGETYKLRLSGAKEPPKWKSGNKSIVSVSKNGVVKGKSSGAATVSARVGRKVYKCRVTVESPKISSVKKIVPVGKSFALKLIGTGRHVKWKSSNRKIASVTENGIVKALNPGSVNIIAEVGKSRYLCKVIVRAGAVLYSERTYAPDSLFVSSVRPADGFYRLKAAF